MAGLTETMAKRPAASLVAGLLAITVAIAPVAAQEKKAPQSPVGGQASGSTAGAEPAGSSITLDPQQIEIVKKVSGYFNGLENLKGVFVQTNADNKKLKGKFFMKKPGRVRFEYSLPSKQLIVSDGQQIAIQDLDINTDDRVMVDQTPFRVLLKNDVDLLRDARILEVQEASDLIVVALQDKSKDAAGKIRLFLATSPALELKEWVTTDAQGLDTRIEVSGLDKSQQIDAALFKVVSPTISATKGQ